MSEAAEKPKAAAAPGGNKKLLLMVLIFNFAIAGGLGYLVLAGRAQPAEKAKHGEDSKEDGHGDEAAEEEEEAPKESGHGSKHAGKFGPLLEVGSFVANLSTPAGANPRYAKITLHVECSGEEAKGRIELALVPLRAEALMYLSSAKPEDIVGQEKIVAISGELQKRFNTLIGKNSIKRVYFSELVVQ